jgi:hypothetical protein
VEEDFLLLGFLLFDGFSLAERLDWNGVILLDLLAGGAQLLTLLGDRSGSEAFLGIRIAFYF